MVNQSCKDGDGKHVGFDYVCGNWSVSCFGRHFRINNKGIKLAVEKGEELKKVIFDTEKKTIEVVVENSISPKVPRVADLSDAPEFFDEIHNGLKEILLTKSNIDDKPFYDSVTPNEDRTVFEVK